MRKVKNDDNIDNQFKKMIKDTISEEGYFKEKDIKVLMNQILSEVDKLIAKRVKEHFYEIGKAISIISKTEEQTESNPDKKQNEENKNA